MTTITAFQGKVTNVEIYPAGDMVDQAYAAGATALLMLDPTDFSELGGQVLINGVVYSYSTVNFDTGILTLTTGLTTAIEDGTNVDIYPSGEEKRALVQLQDGDDSVTAVVPHFLQDRMDVGIRQENESETVTLETVRDQWIIRDIVSLAPKVIASYLDPGTVTPPSASLAAPSAPQLYSKLGTITYTWDGKDATGKVYPAQFDHINVYMGTAPSIPTTSFKETRRNICQNPSFEVGTSNWFTNGGTMTRDTTQASTGTASLKQTRVGTGVASFYYGSASVSAVSPGDVITLAWKSKASNLTSADGAIIHFRDAGGSIVSQYSIGVTATAAWTRNVYTTVPAPPNTAYIVFYALYSASGVDGDQYWVDEVLIEKYCPDRINAPWFDGDTPDTLTTQYDWVGTANNSGSFASAILQGSLQETRRNYCVSPSFEAGLGSWVTTPTYWTNAGGVLTQDASWADSGYYSGKVVCDGTASQQGATITFSGVANQTYIVSATIKNTSGRPVYIRVRDTTNAVNSANSAQVNAGETTRVSTTITCGAAANPTVLVGISTDTTAGASTFNFDSVLIEVGSTLADYFDGYTADVVPDVWYDWVGTAGASASIQQTLIKADANLSNYLDHLFAAGSGIVTKQAGGVTRYFKFRAVDAAGNIGPESAETSIVVQRIVGPDIQANSITTNELQVGSVTADKIELGVVRSNLMADPSLEEDYPLLNWDPYAGSAQNPRRWRIDGTPPASVIIKKTSPVGPIVRTNMVNNPIGPVTTALGWWVGARCALTLSGTGIRGTVNDISVQTGLAVRLNPPAITSMPARPFSNYAFSAYMRTSAVACGGQIQVVFYDSSSVVIGSPVNSALVTLNASTDTRVSVTAQAPGGTAYVYVHIGLGAGTRTTSDWFEVRQVLIEQAESVGTFFDGDSTTTATLSYAWNGTADASTSTETTIPTKRSRSGGRALQITTTVAGEVSGFASPACKVEPGKSYRLSFFAASLGAVSSLNVSMMTGNGDEYSPWYFNDIPLVGDDPTWTSPPLVTEPMDPESMQAYSYTFQVPTSGVTYVCLRFGNFGAGAGSTVIADDFAIVELGGSGATELTAAGLRLFGADGLEIGAFVNNRPNYFSISSQGDTVAAIDSGGIATFTGLSVLGRDTNADDTADQGFQIYGQEFLDWMFQYSQGNAAYGYRTATGAYVTAGVWTDYMEIQGFVLPGHRYRVVCGMLSVSSQTAGASVETRLLYGWNGAVPASQYVWQRTYCPVASTQYAAPALMKTFIPPGVAGDPPVEIRWKLQAMGLSGTGALNVSTTNGLDLYIEDLGLAIPDTSIDYSIASPPPTKKNYVSTWTASSSESYRGDGSARTDTTDLVQGYNSYNGDGHAHILFNSANSTGGETSKTIATALSGATLTKAEVYLYANHWYYNAGGTALIRASTLTTLSGSTPSGTIVSSSGWPIAAGRWVTITSIFGLTSRSVFIGKSGGSNLTYYGRFNYQGNSSGKPQLRLSYTK
jgi:hypothetical protein